MYLHKRIIVILTTVLSIFTSCLSLAQAGWVLVQNNPITIYRDTRTGLEWSVTIANAGNSNVAAQRVVQQYGLRLPTWDELRDVVNNNDAIDWLDIEDGLFDLYETSDPNVLAGAWGGSISTKRPRQALTQTWVIGVRRSSDNSQPPKPQPPNNPNQGSGSGFKLGDIINPEYGDRITHINNIRIQDEDHFREIIRNVDTRITYTLIDNRTGKTYNMMTDLLPKGSTTRLGIYIEDDSRGGVMVTGVMEGTPGMNSRYVGNGNVNLPDNPQSPSPPQNVGKLYVLNVWGQTIDIALHVNKFRDEHDLLMCNLGLKPSSEYGTPDGRMVNFCADYYTLTDQKSYDDRKKAERENPQIVNPNEHIDIVSNRKVLEMCRYISQKAGQNDVILVYICCHGITKRLYGDNRRYHILFPDIYDKSGMDNPNNGIKREDIIAALKTRNHRLTVLITDSCVRETRPPVKEQPFNAPAGAKVFKNNRLYAFLRSNTGFIDWNSASPFGGYDRDGELSILYQSDVDFDDSPKGVFNSAFNSYTSIELPDNQKSFSSSEFFNGLKNELAREYQRCKSNPEIVESTSDFDNQSTQTLFDFKGFGYVIDNRGGYNNNSQQNNNYYYYDDDDW